MIKKDTAIICAVFQAKQPESDYELSELKNLSIAAGIHVKDQMVQFSPKIHPTSYFGSGKVIELKQAIDVLNVDMVIFNDTLSPSQIKFLEKNLDTQVIDRSFLILSIFATRAQTKLAKLEVELAQKMYMLPRLIGLGNVLSRQGGGSYNSKGPGETKLELDRRKILSDISSIKQSLKKAQSEKLVSRKARNESNIPIVALVGYTNVGKSSLMNALAKHLHGSDPVTLEKNMLFATLDTKTIRLHKKDYPPFLLIDTVGFVSKLPHELINSFKSTLSDVLDADLIIHIADGTNFNFTHFDMTEKILDSIGASSIPRILAITKKDLLTTPFYESLSYTLISNHTLENMDVLVDNIYDQIYQDYRMYQIKLPFMKSHLLSKIYQTCYVLKKVELEDAFLLNLYANKYQFEKLKSLSI